MIRSQLLARSSAPTRIRTPSYVRISSSSMLSTVLPAISPCTPQELLPIIPPSVQCVCVAGSGPKVSLCFSAALRRSSRMMPGSTRANFSCGVQLPDAVHVLREIEDHGDVAALSRQRRAAAAREDRRAVFARQSDGGDDVVGVARNHDADRHLAIVRGVGRVQRARAVVETNLAADFATKLGGEDGGIDVQRLDAIAVLDARPHHALMTTAHFVNVSINCLIESRMIALRLGIVQQRLAKFFACSNVMCGGSGGTSGSVRNSRTHGRSAASASSHAAPICSGSSTRDRLSVRATRAYSS